jgi:formamidopyrimidine-DNA glycosylase
MPEMPEVELMTDRLQRWIGYTIQAAAPSHERYLPKNDRVDIIGQKINGVFRRSKFIIFALDKGALLCHNAMSGYWDSDDDRWTFDYVEGNRTSSDKDIRTSMIVNLPEMPLHTARSLYFHDSRKFGYLKYISPEELAAKLDGVGPEILGSKHLYDPLAVMDEETFIDLCKRTKHPVKQLLMDQTKIAGVGNIYAVEGCWHARINPKTPAKELTDLQSLQLYRSTRAVMLRALDFNLDYKYLNIYRRDKCPECSTPTISTELKGRNTWYCPKCQP